MVGGLSSFLAFYDRLLLEIPILSLWIRASFFFCFPTHAPGSGCIYPHLWGLSIDSLTSNNITSYAVMANSHHVSALRLLILWAVIAFCDLSEYIDMDGLSLWLYIELSKSSTGTHYLFTDGRFMRFLFYKIPFSISSAAIGRFAKDVASLQPWFMFFPKQHRTSPCDTLDHNLLSASRRNQQ